MAELRKAEVGHSTSVSIDSRSQTVSGVKFPMSVAAVTALSKFVDSSETNYVQFFIGTIHIYSNKMCSTILNTIIFIRYDKREY